KPVKDADVAIIGENITAKTDEDGVASIDFGFKTKDEDVINRYAKVSIKEKEAVVPLDLKTPYYATDDNTALRDYWKYLYLERELFMPGDEMHFWGVLAPRGKGVDEIKEVLVELKSSSGPHYEGGENTPVLSQKVQVSNKTFEGEIELPILSPDYYYLQVKYGDTILLTRGFSVETYQKPAYQLSLTAEKKAIFAGVGMNFQVEASFFEGTPVPGISLEYHIMDKGGNVTTDEKGRAKIPYIGNARDGEYSPYYNQYLRVSTTLPEAGEIYGSKNIYVFRSSVYLQGEVSREDDEITVLADLSKVNLDMVNQGEYPSEKNFMAGPAGNVLVQGSIYQDVWKKVESGERYDFINKKVVKDYYYNHSTQHVSDFSMITDENGQASFTGELDQENSYYIVLSAEDNEGRKIERRVTVPGSGRPAEYDYKYYHFQEKEQGKKYVPGEAVSLTFLENDTAIPSREKAFLYFRGQKQIETYEVASGSEYGFKFNENSIPNVTAYGVYFDGVSYQETSGYIAAFASESKELKIQIKTDKTQYRPGETVALSVQVTNQNNKPVKAEVNLNLVDEAIYNMVEQHVNLLGTLYSDYIYMYLNVRKSHYHPSFGGGAEKGGEGDGERKDFRDTVIFTSVQTDNEGKAETVFELPDNLTSWRVTYHAVTETLEAGSGTSQIPVKLPFFVELVANNSYLVGDAPVIVLRSYGEKLASQEVVSYTMKLVTPDGQEIASTNQSSAFTALDWSLPVLQEGQYSMIVEGKSGDYQDRIVKEFTVVKSFLERTNTQHSLLEESFGIGNATDIQEPITLVFSDYEKSQYLRGIYQLAWQQGSRLEQQLASKIARHLLNVYFPDKNLYSGREDASNLLRYQQQDGGISILPYAESDLYLTALAASSASAEFDSRAMAGYFYRLLEDEEEKDEIDQSTVLWGLSALNEPILLQINEMLEANELAPAQSIKLALAMLDIGNGAVGKKIFEELLTEFGEDLGATMRINVGRDQDEIIEATTQMALLASRLDNTNKNKLYQYLLENHGEDILNSVEQGLMLQYNLQYMSTKPVSFTYELNGEKVSKTLKNREFLKLTVLPSDVASLKFSEISGKVGVVTAFTASYSAGDIPTQEALNVKRTYRVKKKETNTMERSDLVEVTIGYEIGDKAPAGSYEIVDVLPAGLKYVSRPYNRYEKPVKGLAYPTEVKGQKLTFTAHKGGEKIVY
ncbi:MAG: alpha-2-macroglobulin, partial [Firmicutes bacterium HGW-Firmicutes-12]